MRRGQFIAGMNLAAVRLSGRTRQVNRFILEQDADAAAGFTMLAAGGADRVRNIYKLHLRGQKAAKKASEKIDSAVMHELSAAYLSGIVIGLEMARAGWTIEGNEVIQERGNKHAE